MDAGTGYLHLCYSGELEAVGVEDKKVNQIQDPSLHQLYLILFIMEN